MMRRVVMTTLLLSPVFAQALMPTQPKAPSLHAKLEQPTEISAIVAETSTASASSPLRVSTGVVAPKLIKTVAIEDDHTASFVGVNRKVVVEMIVDANGKPSNLKIAETADARLDQNVLQAVSQYRFTPATVSSQPTAVPMRLEIVLQNSTR